MADEKQERKVPLHNCYICDKEFDKFSLEEHFFTFHNNKVTEENIKKQIQTINKCESCGKSFSNAGYLKRHIRIVHEGHKCESCGNSFSQAQFLKKHIYMVHEGQNCESCGKSFSNTGSLKKHIYKVHKGHKDYKCESCGKSFSRAGTLKKHLIKIHEDPNN